VLRALSNLVLNVSREGALKSFTCMSAAGPLAAKLTKDLRD